MLGTMNNSNDKSIYMAGVNGEFVSDVWNFSHLNLVTRMYPGEFYDALSP